MQNMHAVSESEQCTAQFPKKFTRDESSRVTCICAHKHTYAHEGNHEKYTYGQWERAMHCAHFQRSVREMSLVVLYVCIFAHTQTHIYQRRKP